MERGSGGGGVERGRGGIGLSVGGVLGFPIDGEALEGSSCSSQVSGKVEAGYVDGDGE